MRTLSLLACSLVTAVALVATAGAAPPDSGSLSIEGGKGVVTLDMRGVVLGRLTRGSLRITDLTPRDRFTATVAGRALTQERLGPRTVLYRGQGLRFRMAGGYRITIRGLGISLSAVGRGTVLLDGEPRLAGEETGVYSLDGVDCSLEPELCTPVPSEPERHVIGPPPDGSAPRAGVR